MASYTWPDVQCRISFASLPMDTPVWEDVTPYLRGFKTKRGRQHELDRTETGTATITLDNRDRRFDPTYTGMLFNYCINPSFEADLSGWVSDNDSASTLISTAVSGLNFQSQTHSALVTTGFCNGVPRSVRFYTTFPTVPGATYSFSGYFKSSNPGPSTYLAFDDSNQADPSIHLASTSVVNTGFWQRLSFTFTCPKTVTYGRLAFLLGANSTATIYIDSVQIEISPTVSTYADGSFTGYHWDGVANKSLTRVLPPHYGNIVPMRRLQLYATFQGVDYFIFTGFIEQWPQSWPGAFDGLTTIVAIDGFGAALAQFNLNAPYIQQLSSDRINQVLDDAGWSIGTSWILGDAGSGELNVHTFLGGTTVGRTIDVSQSTLQAQDMTDSGTSALSHLQAIQQVEQGMMFVDGQGNFVFHSRHYRLLNKASQAIFGGTVNNSILNPYNPLTPGQIPELPYIDLVLATDILNVRNQILITPTGGTQVAANDATSQHAYFLRSYQLSNVPLYDPYGTEALALANWLLRAGKNPVPRVSSMIVRPQAADAMWPVVLNSDIDDVLTVHRTPQSLVGGNRIEAICRIEGIQHEVTPYHWQTIYSLTPIDPTPNYWILGDPVSGVLSQTTVLAY